MFFRLQWRRPTPDTLLAPNPNIYIRSLLYQVLEVPGRLGLCLHDIDGIFWAPKNEKSSCCVRIKWLSCTEYVVVYSRVYHLFLALAFAPPPYLWPMTRGFLERAVALYGIEADRSMVVPTIVGPNNAQKAGAPS